MENRIKRFRSRCGMTQRQLSEASGVPQATISEIENGKRIPGVDIALLLAWALGTTVEELFTA